MSMKIRNITLIVLFQVFISGICNGQAIIKNSTGNIAGSGPYISGELITSSSFQPDIVTYFNREWLPGDIILTEGGILRNKMIRYNSLLDELFCLEPESGRIIKPDKEAIVKFHFYNYYGDTAVYFKKLRINEDVSTDSVDAFVQQLYDGKLSLYIRRSLYLDHKEVVRVNNNYYLKDIYKVEPVFYLKHPVKGIYAFKALSRKSILALLPEKDDQIRKYFREAPKYRIKSEDDLIKLMGILDSGN